MFQLYCFFNKLHLVIVSVITRRLWNHESEQTIVDITVGRPRNRVKFTQIKSKFTSNDVIIKKQNEILK